jgi:hypothetical protein
MTNCFLVEPTAETSLVLRNYSIIFKNKKSGFMLAYEAYNNQNIRTKDSIISLTDKLKFTVTLKDYLFFNYTSVDSINIANRVFYFHNSFENDNLLHLNNYVTEENLFPTEEISPELFVKPFAIIELQLNKVKTDQYYINFQEKSSYWRYLLVSDHFKTLTNPAVLNPLINFSGPKEVTLPDNSKALSFESDVPISIKQKSDKQFQLVENYDNINGKGKVIIKNLPHPNVNIISKLNTTQDRVYSEIII